MGNVGFSLELDEFSYLHSTLTNFCFLFLSRSCHFKGIVCKPNIFIRNVLKLQSSTGDIGITIECTYSSIFDFARFLNIAHHVVEIFHFMNSCRLFSSMNTIYTSYSAYLVRFSKFLNCNTDFALASSQSSTIELNVNAMKSLSVE